MESSNSTMGAAPQRIEPVLGMSVHGNLNVEDPVPRNDRAATNSH
jgi:hypothetical protein